MLFRWFRPRGFVVAILLAAWAAPAARPADDPRLETLAKLVRDDSPQVRREALRALAKIPSARSAELALGVLDLPMDASLDYALWLTINDLAEPWIAALQDGSWKPAGRERQLEFALKSLPPAQVGRVLSGVLAERPLPRDGGGPWIELIGAAGPPAMLGRLFAQAADGGFDEAAAVRALKALGEAARLRQARPEGTRTDLAAFLKSPAAAVRAEAGRLAGLWKDDAAVPALADRLAAPDLSATERSLIAEALRQIGSPAAVSRLTALAAEAADPAARRSAALALAALEPARGFPAVVAAAGTVTDEAEGLELWRAALGLKGAAGPLREALGGANLAAPAARAGLRVAREGGRNDVELAAAFAQAGGIAVDAQQLSAEMLRDFAARALADGDPGRGEFVYRRAELACVTCHAIGGAGGRVGPDMTSLGASAPADYLVEAMVQPSAKIKEGYHAINVETKDGLEFSGTLARETPEELVLRNAANQEVTLAKNNVARREQGTLSLMPAGLLDPLPEQDRLDLVAFLSQLGKPGGFDASRGGVARRWHLAQTIHTDAQAGDELWPLTAPWADKRWTATTSFVRGTLPRALIEEITQAQFWTAKLALYAATEVTVSQAGPVTFTLTAGPGAELWVHGRKAGGPGSSTVELIPGTHRVLVRLDPKRIPDAVRLESPDAVFMLN